MNSPIHQTLCFLQRSTLLGSLHVPLLVRLCPLIYGQPISGARRTCLVLSNEHLHRRLRDLADVVVSLLQTQTSKSEGRESEAEREREKMRAWIIHNREEQPV